MRKPDEVVQRTSCFTVTVIEMSGRTHKIDGLLPASKISELLQKVKASLPDMVSCQIGLILNNDLLTSKHGCQDLSELHISQDSFLTVVKMSGMDFFEFVGDVGDEDTIAGLSESETTVRVCLLDDDNCILIRRTASRTFNPRTDLFHGRLTWDICRGTYMWQKAGQAVFSWQHKYRRVRNGLSERESLNKMSDSGWVPRQRLPEAWQQIQLEGDVWHKDAGMLIDGYCILGTRLTGGGSVEEALGILALS